MSYKAENEFRGGYKIGDRFEQNGETYQITGHYSMSFKTQLVKDDKPWGQSYSMIPPVPRRMDKPTEADVLADLANPVSYDARCGPDAMESLSNNDLERLVQLADYALSNDSDRVSAFDTLMASRKARLMVMIMARRLLDATHA